MKLIKNNIILLISSLLFISIGCKKGLLPVIETSVLTEATSSSTAISGGAITSEGSSKVIARGVCWSLARNPTISDSHTLDGVGAGVFESKIQGLRQLTTYYVRAYAMNDEGTSYGSEKSINTGKVAIGDVYGGGIVYDISNNGEIFICSPLDNSWNSNFGHVKRLYTTSGLSLKASNDTIIANTAEDPRLFPYLAVFMCKDLNLNGYNDWLLPTADDWSKIHKNLSSKGLGKFDIDQSYWSSTVSIKSNTHVIYVAEFSNNGKTLNSSTIPLSTDGIKGVRAVRIEKL
jgi:hypothetical protein